MQSIKNSAGKLVCRADGRKGIVEIVQKGLRTVIRFNPDGTLVVTNSKK